MQIRKFSEEAGARVVTSATLVVTGALLVVTKITSNYLLLMRSQHLYNSSCQEARDTQILRQQLVKSTSPQSPLQGNRYKLN